MRVVGLRESATKPIDVTVDAPQMEGEMNTRTLLLLCAAGLTGCAVESPWVTQEQFQTFQKKIAEERAKKEMKDQARLEQVLNTLTIGQQNFATRNEVTQRWLQLDNMEARINNMLELVKKQHEESLRGIQAAQLSLEQAIASSNQMLEQRVRLTNLVSSLEDVFAKIVKGEKEELTKRLKQLEVTLQNIDQIAAKTKLQP